MLSVMMLLFEHEVVEDYKVEDNLLQVDDEQVLILNWLVVQAFFKAEMHEQIIKGACHHDDEHQDEEEIHL